MIPLPRRIRLGHRRQVGQRHHRVLPPRLRRPHDVDAEALRLLHERDLVVPVPAPARGRAADADGGPHGKDPPVSLRWPPAAPVARGRAGGGPVRWFRCRPTLPCPPVPARTVPLWWEASVAPARPPARAAPAAPCCSCPMRTAVPARGRTRSSPVSSRAATGRSWWTCATRAARRGRRGPPCPTRSPTWRRTWRPWPRRSPRSTGSRRSWWATASVRAWPSSSPVAVPNWSAAWSPSAPPAGSSTRPCPVRTNPWRSG